MNVNMNNVNSNNGRSLVTGVSAWLEEKVRESPGCLERFVCETYSAGQSLHGAAFALMELSK